MFLRKQVWQFVKCGGEVELFSAPSGAGEWIESHRDYEIEQY